MEGQASRLSSHPLHLLLLARQARCLSLHYEVIIGIAASFLDLVVGIWDFPYTRLPMKPNELLKALYAQPGDDSIAHNAERRLLAHLTNASGVLRIALIGCTGSIGRSVIEVVRANPDRLKIGALAAGSSAIELLKLFFLMCGSTALTPPTLSA